MSDNKFKRFQKGVILKPTDGGANPQVADPTDAVEGSMWAFGDRIKSYINAAIRVFVTEDETQTLTNKTIGDTNTINAQDDAFTIDDATDATMQIAFDAAGTTGTKTTITGSQTVDRVITTPDATDTLVGKATIDTLTNKTIGDSNIINAQDDAFTIDDAADATIQIEFDAAGTTSTKTTITSSQTSNQIVTIPDATDTLVGKATTDTLTNKTLTSAVLDAGVSGTAVKDEDDMLSDSATHVATQQSIKAYVDSQVTAQDLDTAGDSGTGSIDLDSQSLTVAGGVGTTSTASGQTITIDIDSTVATLTGSQSLTNKTIGDTNTINAQDDAFSIQDAADATLEIDFDAAGTTGTKTTITSSQTSNQVITVPDVTDTLVTKTTTDVLTNKTTTDLIQNGTAAGTAIKDEDDMLSDSDTHLATQQSIKAYVDAQASSQNLDTAGDSGTGSIDLATQSLTVTGGTGVDSTASGQSVTLNIDSTVATLTGTQTLINKVITGNSADTLVRATGNTQIVTIPDVSVGDDFVTAQHNQTLTNKIYDGGTASIQSRLNIPSNTKNNLDALARSATALVYATDEDALYLDDGTSLIAVGSGAGGSGSKNYIDADDSLFEGASNTWAAYNDGSAYIDGTGGVSTIILGTTTTASEILEGTTSLKITKPASDVQYEGVSVLSTAVDRADQGKTLFINMSGDFSNATSNHWEVRAYDVTNSVILYTGPADARLISPIKGLLSVPVYLASDTASIRVSLHMTDTDAAGYDIFVDEVKLGPSAVSLVPQIVDWVDFTPTGTWSANTTYFGKYRRTGDTMEIEGLVETSGAPTGTWTFDIPNGLTIDTTKITSTSIGEPVFGVCGAHETGVINSIGNITINSTTSLTAVGTINAGLWSATNPITFLAGDRVRFRATIPILEWANSSQIMNENELALQTIRAKYLISASSANLSFADATDERVDFDDVVFDTHSTVTTGASWVFTSPISAYYRVSALVSWSTNSNLNTTKTYVYKNGSLDTRLSFTGTDIGSGGSTVVQLDAGETLSMWANQDDSAAGARTVQSGTSESSITIEEIPDFTFYGAVRAPVTVEDARFYSMSGLSSNNTAIPYFGSTAFNNISDLGTIVNDSSDGFSFTATYRCKVNATLGLSRSSGNTVYGWSLNPTAGDLDTVLGSLIQTKVRGSATGVNGTGDAIPPATAIFVMEVGDVIYAHGNSGHTYITGTSDTYVNLLVERL